MDDFEYLITTNKMYVDKTKLIFDLAKEHGGYYFLSRPRRFGKTLLCTTIKALYEGKRELFKGLAIEKLWNWEERVSPVIQINMSSCETSDYTKLDDDMNLLMERQAQLHGIKYNKSSKSPKHFLADLINQLHRRHNKRVVLLIDEYDKPLHPFIGSNYMVTSPDGKQEMKVVAMRNKLAEFYGVIKEYDAKIEFLLLTGVSRIAKTNLFSKLNNLRDISYELSYGNLLGYTHNEVKHYFDNYLQRLSDKLECSKAEVFSKLVEKYNGYLFHIDGEQVFNPFSLMQVLASCEFANYWYASGNPAMLVNILNEHPVAPKQLIQASIYDLVADSLKLEKPNITSLMFQTGYLTLKGRDDNGFIVGAPNKEVEDSLRITLASELSDVTHEDFRSYTASIKQALLHNNIEDALSALESLIYTIPHEIMKKMEGAAQFQLIFYLVIKMLDFEIPMEQSMLRGRIDAILETPTRRFIIEFKINKDPEKGLDQIMERKYLTPYQAMKDKDLYLMGISIFSADNHIEYKMQKFHDPT